MAVKWKVFQKNLREPLDRVGRADKPQAFSWTNLSAFSASVASVSMNTSGELEVYGFLGTGIQTASTVDTFSRREGDLRLRVLGLRAVAKNTAQRASLEKDYASDARAILKTVSLDIGDKRKVGHLILRQACDRGLLP